MGGAKKKNGKAGVGERTEAPDQIERACIAVLGKVDTLITTQFLTAQKASVCALDKKFFKVVKGITDQLDSKMRIVTRSSRDKLARGSKRLDITVKLVKLYKAWVRKPNSEEFLAEFTGLNEFAHGEPEVEFEIPSCMKHDIIEMSFTCRVKAVILQKGHEGLDMPELWLSISLEDSTDMTSEEKGNWQIELVNSVIVSIFMGFDESEKAEVTNQFVIISLLKLLEPFPVLPQRTLAFKLAQTLEDDLLMLRAIMDTSGFAGRTEEVKRYITELRRSSSSTMKLFTLPKGRQVLAALQSACSEQGKKDSALLRLESFVQEATCLEQMLRVDAELSALQFQVKPTIMKHYYQMMKELLEVIATQIHTTLLSVLNGSCDVAIFAELSVQSFKVDTLPMLSTIESLKWFECKEISSDMRQTFAEVVAFFKVICVAPVKLMLPEIKGCHVQLDQLGDLAPFSAALNLKSGLRSTLQLVGFDHEAVVPQAVSKCSGLFADQETKVIEPKMKLVTAILYKDRDP